MNRIDHTSLDGRLLTMFVTVYETGSVTAAARELNVTQSTVSHGLNRLREITGDAIFVPVGRGITPTERADVLVIEARKLLSGMEKFSQIDTYDPATDDRLFTIAASDYEIELIIKPLVAQLRSCAPHVQLCVMRGHSQDEWVDLLRSGHADLVLSIQLKTDETDLMQQRILRDDEDICYFDPDHQVPPNTLDRYCAAPHVIMSPGKFRTTFVDRKLGELGRQRHIALSLPSFSTVASILRGTDLIALMPLRLCDTVFAGISTCLPPFELPKDTITQTWHSRTNASPSHNWLRAQVQAVVS